VSFDLYSVCSIIPSAFFLTMSLLLFSMKEKSRATFYFGLDLLLFSVFFFFFFSAVAIDHPAAAYYRFMVVAVIYAIEIVMFLFITSYPDKSESCLIRVFTISLVLFSAVVWIWYVIYTLKYSPPPVFDFESHSYEFPVSLPDLVVSLWVNILVIIFVFAGIVKVSRLKDVKKWPIIIIITLTTSVTFLATASNMMSKYGYVSRGTFYLIQDFIDIGAYFLSTVTYINATKDRSSLMVKVIGISLATFLLILQVLSFLSLKDQELAYDQIAQRDTVVASHSHELTRNMNYFICFNREWKRTVLIGSCPDKSDTAGEAGQKTWIYEKIRNMNGYISRNDAAELFNQAGISAKGYANVVDDFIAGQGGVAPASLVMHQIDSITPEAAQLYRKISIIPSEDFPLKAAQTIRSASREKTGVLGRSAAEYAILSKTSGNSCKKLILSMIEPMQPAGTRRFTADSTGKRYAVFTIISRNGEICEAGFSYEGYRAYLHPLAQSYLIALVVVTLVIIVGFRFFFLNTITRPLKFIESGIREVEKGNLKIEVPVLVEDEIGRIAHTFNAMIRKIADSELTLEQKVQDRTAQLGNSNKELSSTLQLLKATQDDLVRREKMAGLGDMVAGVAHEINTPIGVSLTAATFLERKTNEIAVETANGYLTRSALDSFLSTAKETSRIITSNLGRAAELISSFKKVAVAQTSEEKGEFRVEQYIHDLLLNLRPALKKTKISVVVECDNTLAITSYPGAFSQIFTNLIMNTIIHGFTPEQLGTIIIRIRKEDGNVFIEYSDDGAGIPPNNIQKVFEPFFTTSRNRGGTGLGLHIIYNIVTQKLNGTITAESIEGKGVKFTIRFPVLET